MRVQGQSVEPKMQLQVIQGACGAIAPVPNHGMSRQFGVPADLVFAAAFR